MDIVFRLTNLKELNCSSNNLITTLDLSDCVNLQTIICSNNKLTKIKLPKGERLESLDLRDNNFPRQDLSFLSNLVNLKELYLDNNKFFGSLEFLKDFNKLQKLDISDTNIDSGLEYLPDSVEDFYCSVDKRKNAKCKTLYKLFANDQGVVETEGYKDKYIKNLPQKLQAIKSQIKERNKHLFAKELAEREQLQEENPSLNKKITELEKELQIERETNQASAEVMDSFYRRQFIINKDPEQIIINNFANDYLSINQENKKLKTKIQELEKALKTTEQLAELEVEKQVAQIVQTETYGKLGSSK